MNPLHYSVLIVDNSRAVRIMLQQLLESQGFQTSVCDTGAEALAFLVKHEVELVCAGYRLSDMDGEQLCTHIRHMQGQQNTRIMLFTSEDNPELLRRVLVAGATDIYSKDHFHIFDTYIQRLAATLRKSIIAQALIVEDSPSQLQWLVALLIERGFDVDTFSRAEQALAAFAKNHYDIVITDIVLEGDMSGITLVREIRRDPSDKGLTPIFAVSGYESNARRIELFHIGVNDYMSKPLIVDEFLSRVINLVEMHRLLNELSLEKRHLQEMALIDQVTGIYNRAAFNAFSVSELANAQRTNKPISLAILDIDFFKKINDNHGHSVGDKVLVEVARWLQNTLRKGDMVFRWGGEEFAILLMNCPPKDALVLLDQQRLRFNKRQYAGLNITVSAGISGYTLEQLPDAVIKTLFLEADKALYHAKQTGRDKVCLYYSAL